MENSEGSASAVGSQTLTRFVFRLPSFLPLPDGISINIPFPSLDGRSVMSAFAIVRLHQVELDATEIKSDYMCALEAINRIQAGTVGRKSVEWPSQFKSWHTVADVITTVESPDNPPAHWDGLRQNLGPRQDAVMRSVEAVRSIARAVRLCGQDRVVLPSYEKLPMMWQRLSAPDEHVGDFLRIPSDSEWEHVGLLLLDHSNFAGAEETDEGRQHVIREESEFWARGLAAGSASILSREQFIVAGGLLRRSGEYGAAVVAAATGVEVMTDALLSALMWEESLIAGGPSARVVGGSFAEGKSGARVLSDLAPRLGGNWTSPSSAWRRWHSGGARLRNRSVHGGYQPTRAESTGALDLAKALETFTFDRLTEKRNRYPRVTLMLVARSGLEKRGCYGGRIREFSEKVAPAEPPWVESFAGWHRELIDARL